MLLAKLEKRLSGRRSRDSSPESSSSDSDQQVDPDVPASSSAFPELTGLSKGTWKAVSRGKFVDLVKFSLARLRAVPLTSRKKARSSVFLDASGQLLSLPSAGIVVEPLFENRRQQFGLFVLWNTMG